MNAATRPPLYAYEEAYKSYRPAAGSYKSPQRRIRKFSDTEYNKLIELAGSAIPLNDAHYFAITSNKPGELKTLLKQMGIVSPANIAVLSGRVNLQYPLNKNGKAQCAEELQKIKKIIAGGPIQRYDATNPLIAYNAAGDRVNLTKANDYTNSVYQEGESGQTFVLNEATAKLAQELQTSQKQQQAKSNLFNYILAGVAILAVIVIIWSVNKNKK